MKESSTLIASNLDYEPILWKGLTYTEFLRYLFMTAVVNAFVGLILALFIGLFVNMTAGYFLITLLFLIFGSMVSMAYIATYLAKAKPGKPEGYHGQLISIFLHKKLGIRLNFIKSTCHWRSLRSNYER